MADGKVFPTDRMTSRERLLAAYRGQEVDRIPWWAKATNDNWRAGQPAAIARMTDAELLDFIHADGLFGVRFAHTVLRPRITVKTISSTYSRLVVTRTPDGDLTERWQHDPRTRSWHPVEFPIKTKEDITRFRWLYADVTIENDIASLDAGRQRVRDIGQRGVTVQWWGTSPLMDLVEHFAGPVNTTYMLADFPREMAELMDLMHADCLARASHVARHSPADVIVSGENTSTTLISPRQFEEHCLGRLCEYGRAIESAGKMHELHMCGHLKALLGRIDTIPAASIEAFTAPTLGNTRLADGRSKAPGKTLIGGTNAMIWLRSIDEIKAYIQTELDACPNHRRIILTTAGVAPQFCPAETLREIGAWLAQFRPRM
ncbi:MAG: uroporphyrinogen decarboxylase family protein [Phycisphaerae bacterium]